MLVFLYAKGNKGLKRYSAFRNIFLSDTSGWFAILLKHIKICYNGMEINK